MTDTDMQIDRTVLAMGNWVLDNSDGGIIEQHMLYPVARYLLFGEPVEHGDFLEAVILDKPFSVVVPLADDQNRRAFMTWHKLLHNIFPSSAWRSVENVRGWIEMGGTDGHLTPYMEKYLP